MSQTAPSTVRCPACGTPGSGRFCSTCGAPLDASACAGCSAPLTPGAKFCHRCALAAGAVLAAARRAAAPSAANVLPWGVAFVALLAVAAMAAGRNFGAARGSGLDAPLNALPQAALGEGPGAGAPAAPFAGGGDAAGRPPSLENMSPRDIADRLFDRIMRLSSEGKADSVGFFAEMALQNYAQMPSLDADLRYDMGRVAEVAGREEVARAQADSILRAQPNHLLGLVLATKAATMRGDAAALAGFNRRLVAAAPAERAKNLDEYQRHATDIETALSQAATP
ncbi:zinc ribbon domain-containing protein [Roseisolibacter sp. H3M3-2]|uniref:zinc ribbon domain-containing protein n=1 Tax=Roseisolibacter sp. H3M3-2 TaxID=3031323 RepID=UPI0023DC9FDE|nr:zinc ribbon domain-containing protein [Roseisolibacter sp. H3M3-2]MDF1502591.1 zinc ribbon domain-containing protein [Roseisolibacter sp. H3M3-2]